MSSQVPPEPITDTFNPTAWNLPELTPEEEAFLNANFVKYPITQSNTITFPTAPIAPTLANGTNTTQVATTGFVQNAITAFKAAINVWSALNTFNGGLSATSITRTGTLTITGTPLALSGTRVDTPIALNYSYPVAANSIGEIVTSTVATLATTPNTVQNLTSLTLTKGVWFLQADTSLSITLSNGTFTAVGFNTASATLTGARAQHTNINQVTGAAPSSTVSTAMTISINASTLYYVVGLVNQAGTYNWTNIVFSATRIA